MNIILHQLSFIATNFFCCFENMIYYYRKIQSYENNKLMIPTIRKAFTCMSSHLFITSIIFEIYNLSLVKFQGITASVIPLIFMISVLLIVFRIAKHFLEKALSSNRIDLASNIYFISNGYIVILAMLNFRCSYSEYDQVICLCICIFWLTHSYNLIPGKYFLKIFFFLITCLILFLICQPKRGFGFITIIGHLSSYVIQIYYIWEKYHDECQLFNTIEYEKNVNRFLQEEFPDPVFTLNSNLDLVKINEKADKLLCNKEKITSFKDFTSALMNETNSNLYTELQNNKYMKNVEYSKILESDEIQKYIATCISFCIDKNQVTTLILRDFTKIYQKQERNLSNKYQNILLFSAPHEIRSQLNLITGNLEQLEKKFDFEKLKIAKFGSKILEHKLNLIFDFVHIVTNQFSPHNKEFTFIDLIEEAGEIIQFYCKAKNISFSKKYRTKNEIILCDYDRLLSMIIHISLNAIKYTPSNGEIQLKIHNEKGLISTCITDTGIGINSESL